MTKQFAVSVERQLFQFGVLVIEASSEDEAEAMVVKKFEEAQNETLTSEAERCVSWSEATWDPLGTPEVIDAVPTEELELPIVLSDGAYRDAFIKATCRRIERLKAETARGRSALKALRGGMTPDDFLDAPRTA